MLLERSSELDRLQEALSSALRGQGRVALVGGEAGIGKTSLVDGFTRERAGKVRVLWGGCEALNTPRPLGPLRDMARDLPEEFRDVLAGGADRGTLFAALLDTIENESPCVLVIEDAHWADEATLDLIKFLGRRIHRYSALLVLTIRDDEVPGGHPLRSVLGDLPARSVVRIPLLPLSPEAVSALAKGTAADPADLHRTTGGNPFFVTEILSNPFAGVPATVADAVLSRVNRQADPERQFLEVLSVMPGRGEDRLLREAATPDPGTLERCLASGMVRSDGEFFQFRHELARRAVEEALPAHRRRDLHGRILAILAEMPDTPGRLPRLVHHAAGAGDTGAVRRYAPPAARQAAAVGAHREAASHYALALSRGGPLPDEERLPLLEGRAYECYLTGQMQEAVAAREEALELGRRLGRADVEGEALRWLSRLNWFLGRKPEVDRYAREAIHVLETLPPSANLAMAYSNRAQVHMLEDEVAEAIAWGQKAFALGQELGSTEIMSHALNNVGTARLLSGDAVGFAELEESLRLALEGNLDEHAARAWTNLASSLVVSRNYPRALDYLDAGINYAVERDLDAWSLYMTGWRAQAHLDRGDWTEAAAEAGALLGRFGVPPVSRIPALVVLGRVRARRGDPGAWEVLNEALELARTTGEIQRLAPVAAARTELSLLEENFERAREEHGETFAVAQRRGNAWILGELSLHHHVLGLPGNVPVRIAEPWRLLIGGEWKAAADLWAKHESPYERAEALSRGDNASRIEALEIFGSLGAGPAARILARKLREEGVKGIPRGPRPVTRRNPAGLTPRQLEILGLITEGLSNAEIGERLFISPKTADHHVSAVLARLDVRTRAEAAALALRSGLVAQSREGRRPK